MIVCYFSEVTVEEPGADMALPFKDSLSSSNRLIQLNNENKLKTLEPPRIFSHPPEKRPCCVCFDYTGKKNPDNIMLIFCK